MSDRVKAYIGAALFLALVGMAGSAELAAAHHAARGVASTYPATAGFSGAHVALPSFMGGRYDGTAYAYVDVCNGERCATFPAVDWCQCYAGTADERIIDLNHAAWAILTDEPHGLLHGVTVAVHHVGTAPGPRETAAAASMLPNTSIEPDGPPWGIVTLLVAVGAAALIAWALARYGRRIRRRRAVEDHRRGVTYAARRIAPTIRATEGANVAELSLPIAELQDVTSTDAWIERYLLPWQDAMRVQGYRYFEGRQEFDRFVYKAYR